MNHATAKGGWARPPLAPSELPPFASADAAWRQGQEAEEDFDYELARHCYLAAVHQTHGGGSLGAVVRYTEFLVERLGASAEVGIWLDDPAFVVPTDTKGPGKQLALLLGQAAAAVNHPRGPEIDALLAAQGELSALARQSQRALDGDDLEGAYQFLAQAEGRIAGEATALAVWNRVQQLRTERAQAALAPAAAALDAGDLDLATRALLEQRPIWGQHPTFASLEHHRDRMAERLGAEALRQELDRLADEQAWDLALPVARRLAESPVAADADRAWLAHVQRQVLQAELARLWAQAAAAEPQARWTVLATLAGRIGAGIATPAELSDPLLAAAWQTVAEAAGCSVQQPLAHRIAALATLHALRDLDPLAAAEELQALTDRLPAEWRAGPTAKAALARLAELRLQAQAEEESAFVEVVQAMIDGGDLDDAAAAVAQWVRSQSQVSGPIKALRGDLQAARLTAERLQRLRQDFEAALDRGAWFHARQVLSELVHLEPAQRVQEWGDKLEQLAGPALRAQAMPPGLQKLGPGSVATGVVDGRLLVIQDRTWMTVVLSTLGLQPFALPEDWAVDTSAAVRLGSISGGVRLTGLSRGRLVVIDQQTGEAPGVQAAIDLQRALRGDDLLVSSALEPSARRFSLLSRHSHRGVATTWTTLDAGTLEVTGHVRTSPCLASAVAIRHMEDRLLVAVHSRDRQGPKAWAVGLVDGDNKVLSRWTDAEIGEWVAGFRDAVAWPEQDRIFARFLHFDPFDPNQARDEPTLLVLRQGRVVFASTDLRRRFAPQDRLTIDHAWTLDPVAGRLWFAALSTEAGSPDALLLGVDARTLRADPPVVVPGAARILSLMPVTEGAVALCRMQGGHFSLARATWVGGHPELTTHRLPL